MNKTYILIAGLILGIVGISVSADSPSKKLFDAKCASCHGKDLKGSPTMGKALKLAISALDLTDEATIIKTDEVLIDITSKGLGKMPAYAKTLKPPEIKGLIDYLRSVSPKKVEKVETK